eukprot:5264813-Lingulodinium_polyedra.AAC.1
MWRWAKPRGAPQLFGAIRTDCRGWSVTASRRVVVRRPRGWQWSGAVNAQSFYVGYKREWG